MDVGTEPMTGPVLPPAGSAVPVEVVESRQTRLHRPLDLIRLTARDYAGFLTAPPSASPVPAAPT